MSRLDESEVPCWDQPTENVCGFTSPSPSLRFLEPNKLEQICTMQYYACKNQWTLPWKVQALRESCNLDATVTFTPWRNPALMALHSRNVQGNLTKFWWSNTNSRKVKHKGKFARPIAHRSLHCVRMILVKVPLSKKKQTIYDQILNEIRSVSKKCKSNYVKLPFLRDGLKVGWRAG